MWEWCWNGQRCLSGTLVQGAGWGGVEGKHCRSDSVVVAVAVAALVYATGVVGLGSGIDGNQPPIA